MSGINLVPQERRALCATEGFLFEAPASEQRSAFPLQEGRGGVQWHAKQAEGSAALTDYP